MAGPAAVTNGNGVLDQLAAYKPPVTAKLTTQAANVEAFLGNFANGECKFDKDSHAGICAAVIDADPKKGPKSTIPEVMTTPLPGGLPARPVVSPALPAVVAADPSKAKTTLPTAVPVDNPALAGSTTATGLDPKLAASVVGANAATPITPAMLLAGASPNTQKLMAAGLTIAPMYVSKDPVEGKAQIAKYLLEHRFNKADVAAALLAYNTNNAGKGQEVTAEQYANAYAEMIWSANGGDDPKNVQGNMRTIAIVDESTTAALGKTVAASDPNKRIAGLTPGNADRLNTMVMRTMQQGNHWTDQDIQARDIVVVGKLNKSQLRLGNSDRAAVFTPPQKTSRVIAYTPDPAIARSSADSSLATGQVMPQTAGLVAAKDDATRREQEALQMKAGGQFVAPTIVAAMLAQEYANKTIVGRNRTIAARAVAESVRATYGLPYGVLAGVAGAVA